MSASVSPQTTEDKRLEPYRAYALLEKEKNLLLLLDAFSQNNDGIRSIFEKERDINSRTQCIKTLLDSTSQESDLGTILRGLEQTDTALNELKKNVGKELSDEIDKHRAGIRNKDNLKKAFSALTPSTMGITVGLSDPSYMGYVSSGSPGGGGGGVSVSSSPVFQQLKNIAEILLSAHFGLIAQVVYGLAIIVNFMMSELSSAKRLDKNIQELTKKNSGFALRFKKNMLVLGLFMLRLLIFGITIGLTVTAILTPIGLAVLLLVALSSYLFEEFRHLSIEKESLAKLRAEIKEKKVEGNMKLCDEHILNPSNTVKMRLDNIATLEELRLTSARGEIAVGLLEKKVAVSVGRRNKTLYSAMGATFIILSFAFPPFFFVGVTMLVVPLVVGAARYVDEKLNKGRLSNAVANSRLAQFITKSAIYKKVFDDRPSPEQKKIELEDLNLMAEPEKTEIKSVSAEAQETQVPLGFGEKKPFLLSAQIASPELKTGNETEEPMITGKSPKRSPHNN
jgi:hypothetical protein